jgi:hypothetical protein
VIVCACAIGTFCITTIVVVQVPWLPVTEGVEGCAHAQPEVAEYPHSDHVTSGCSPFFPHKYDFVRTHILYTTHVSSFK